MCQEINSPEANTAQPESILMGSLEELSPEHQQTQQERYPDGTMTMHVTHPEANIQNNKGDIRTETGKPQNMLAKDSDLS